MFKVLSIDGGGIRGAIPAVLLRHIENAAGKPVSELFDLVVGTSTGGIIAAGLTAPDAEAKPKFSAADMLALYRERGGEIFYRSFWKDITSLCGIIDEQYDEGPFEDLLEEYLGDATLKDCLVPIVVTSYDIELRRPYFFKTRRAKESHDRNHFLREVVRATSAAPTYFEPMKVGSMAEEPSRRILVDGGVFVSNPAMCGFSEAGAMGVARDDLLIASLGTGIATRKIAYEDAKGWGKLGWAQPIIGVMMDGQADATDFHLNELLPGADAGEAQRYFRFDTPLDVARDDLDAAGPDNIRDLEAEAEQIIAQQAAALSRLVARLTD